MLHAGDTGAVYSGNKRRFVHGSDRFLRAAVVLVVMTLPLSLLLSLATALSGLAFTGLESEVVFVLMRGLAREHHRRTSISPLLRLRARIGMRSSTYVGCGGGGGGWDSELTQYIGCRWWLGVVAIISLLFRSCDN